MKKQLTPEQEASLETAKLIIEALYPHRYFGSGKYAPPPANMQPVNRLRPN